MGLVNSGLDVWRPAGPSLPSWLTVVVTTRRGGASPAPWDSLNLGLATGDDPERVRENRARVRDALGLRPERLVHLSQVHGTRIWRVPDPEAHEGDGMWTDVPGTALAVGVADCVPAFLWDEAGRRLALVHAGWRGTAAGIVARAVATLHAAGARPRDLRVALGPSIGPCCYTVQPEVAAQFPAPAVLRRQSALHLDLRLANRLQAEAAGVDPASIAADPPCTACRTDLFFSHRRLGPRTGRMWALACMAVGGDA